MRRAVGFGLVALTCAVGPTAGATAPGPEAHPGVLALAAQFPGADWFAASAGTAESVTTGTGVIDTGDLTGDGRRDVVEHRGLHTSESSSLGIYARDGETGRLAWQQVFRRGPGHLLDAFPARTGRGSRPGLVIADYWRTTAANGVDSHLVVTGLDGRGRVLWSRTQTGTERHDGDVRRFRNEPAALRIADLRQGSNDVVIYLVDRDEDPSAARDSGSVTALRISGADGTAAPLGKITSEDALPVAGLVPDQDGDGHDDLFVADPGSAGTLDVRAGRTGSRVWLATVLAARSSYGFYVVPAGRLTGAVAAGRPVQDVVLLSGAGAPLTVGTTVLPVPDPRTSAHGHALLLAGGTGKEVWSHPADDAIALGRAGTARKPAVALVLDSESAPGQISARAVDGTELWSGSAGPNGTDPYAGGDLDGDGTTDLAVELYLAGDEEPSGARYLSGATGAQLAARDALPLRRSLDGAGDDLVVVEEDDSVRLTFVDGRSGRSLFAATLPGGGPSGLVPVGAGRCAEVVAWSDRGWRGSTVVALSSAGQQRWVLRHDGADLDPGRVTSGAATVRRGC